MTTVKLSYLKPKPMSRGQQTALLICAIIPLLWPVLAFIAVAYLFAFSLIVVLNVTIWLCVVGWIVTRWLAILVWRSAVLVSHTAAWLIPLLLARSLVLARRIRAHS